MAKWLYIPVEVKVRELHAKMLLAKHAVARGYKVVIGRKAEMMYAVPFLPPGIFFGMWVQANFKDYFEKLKKLGFYTTGLDEEGLVTFSDDMYARFKLCPETLKNVDCFFAWGQYQANLAKNFIADTAVKVVGNLRFDPLRKELRGILDDEKNNLQKRYGQYILIVSSFGLNNHFNGAENYLATLRKSMVIRSDEEEIFLRRYMALQEKVFSGLLSVIPLLAKTYPDYTFVIRPHPGENISLWRSCAEKFSNVVIENDGNIHSWILGAKCVVHHFCTTALESYSADIPSIAFRPVKDDELESSLPYIGSLEAVTDNDLIIKVGNFLSDDFSELNERRRQAHPILKTYIQNLDGPFCYNQILDTLEGVKVSSAQKRPIFVYSFKSMIRNILRNVKRTIFSSKETYVDHKFPALDKVEIENILRNIPGDTIVKVKRLSPYCYILSSNNDNA
jgi:surface carbohydrate biosynthesis protein